MSKTKEEILDDQLSIMISKPEDDYIKLDVMKKKPAYQFCLAAMELYGRTQYNQGILDLLDKSDGLDMNFQADKLFKNENDEGK